MISPILTFDTESECSTITINQNILQCILYIQSKDEESFVKQSF